jgi:DNA polymerase elongation subunit (family B)
LSAFYTNVQHNRGEILFRGYDRQGKRIHKRVKYKPYLFVPAKLSQATHKSIWGNPLAKLDFDSISDAKDFIEKYEDVSNFEYHGLTRWQYAFINDTYPGQVDFDVNKVRGTYLDIEVNSEGGFPIIEQADKAVTAITLSDGKMYYVLGLGDFMTDDPEIEYIQCDNEKALLFKFLDIWEELDSDYVTGWNVEGFDLPYLFRRIERLLGKEMALRMSPWRMARWRKYHDKMGRENEAIMLEGIATLDYIALYLKFTYSKQEQYTLGYIAKVELGDTKVDYRTLGYVDLADLYRRNHQLYIEYNIHDVRLVVRLEAKMKFLEQAMAIAYDAKINFEDATTSVLLWDIIIHNYLLDKGIAIPRQKKASKNKAIEGAYVKEPKVGAYHWLMSFDLQSLYPHLIMMFNISPETFVGMFPGVTPEQILSAFWKVEEFKKRNVSICGNGAMFTNEVMGFLPELMDRYYNDRAKYKKMMIECQKALVDDPGNEELKRKIIQYNNLQMAKKISLNSAYGALSNEWFRYYNDDLAEAITLSGQTVIRWAAIHMNQYLNKIAGTKDVDYVIASDTDSLYVSMEAVVAKYMAGQDVQSIVAKLDKIAQEKFQPFIGQFYEELAERMNAYAQKMFMKREAIAERAIWSGAKRYIMLVWNNEGVQYKEAKFKMVGIEAVRASTATICRDIIKEGARVIIDLDQSRVYDFMEKAKDKFYSASIPDISRNSSVSDLGKYVPGQKSIPPNVNGSLTFNKLIRERGLEDKIAFIKDGDRVKYTRLKMPNPARAQWIAFPNGELPAELGLEDYVNKDDLAEVGFVTPLRTLASAAGLTLEPVATLESFFA